MFLSTPFHPGAVGCSARSRRLQDRLGRPDYTGLLESVAATGNRSCCRRGAATMDEVRTAKDTIEAVWNDAGVSPGLAVLHCTVSYPTEPADANLSAIPDLATLGATVGFSDHTIGIDAAVLSVALGARVIEKHFTLDKNHSDFRDHALSADPGDMKALVAGVRNAEALIGRGGKRVLDCEAEVGPAVRRSVHALRDIAAGAELTSDDIVCVRPEGGIAPSGEIALAGRTAKAAITAGTPLTEDMPRLTMCGIAGYIGPTPPDPSHVEACEALMGRRGPDANGRYGHRLSDDQVVVLLHSRLSIIDLDPRANQPDADRRPCDRQQRRDLQLPGARRSATQRGRDANHVERHRSNARRHRDLGHGQGARPGGRHVGLRRRGRGREDADPRARPVRREAALPAGDRERPLFRVRGEVPVRAVGPATARRHRPPQAVPRERLQGAAQGGGYVPRKCARAARRIGPDDHAARPDRDQILDTRNLPRRQPVLRRQRRGNARSTDRRGRPAPARRRPARLLPVGRRRLQRDHFHRAPRLRP